MTEICIISVILLSAAAIICAALPEKIFMKTPKTDEETEAETVGESEISLSPMFLRNGYGVTRDKNPTFAEQWVNIMNYSGESQLEGDYEETE